MKQGAPQLVSRALLCNRTDGSGESLEMNWGKFKVDFWSAIGGAIVMGVIGFKWGGWVTGGTAQIMAGEAVVDRLALICVAQFNQDLQKD